MYISVVILTFCLFPVFWRVWRELEVALGLTCTGKWVVEGGFVLFLVDAVGSFRMV